MQAGTVFFLFTASQQITCQLQFPPSTISAVWRWRWVQVIGGGCGFHAARKQRRVAAFVTRDARLSGKETRMPSVLAPSRKRLSGVWWCGRQTGCPGVRRITFCSSEISDFAYISVEDRGLSRCSSLKIWQIYFPIGIKWPLLITAWAMKRRLLSIGLGE